MSDTRMEGSRPAASVRLDVWLDVSCLCRTRSEAQRAAKGGKIEINGRRAKPHRVLHPGDEVRITRPNGTRQVVIVLGIAERHLPKAKARALYDDRTPPPDAGEVEFRALLRHAGPARTAATPDKRQRRQLRRLKGHA